MIKDGLLCSILCALSRSPNIEELISCIERDTPDVSEILEARRKLFTYFSGVMCTDRKKLILDIDRHTTKNYIKDVVDQLLKVDKVSEAKMFCMPYNYVVRKFEAESERLSKAIEKEMSNEFDLKIEALEHRMNEKQRALHDSILENINRVLGQRPSYASIANGAQGSTIYTPVGTKEIAGSNPGQLGARGPLPAVRGGAEVQQNQLLGIQGGNKLRSRSPSVKRLRSDDGSPVEVQTGKARSSSRPPQKKGIVGTSNNSVTSRKMRSPPADIFIWGVHPDTTVQDIVADLSESGIFIEEKDIQKKSKPEANLVSYKISVKAEDLQRALDPSVWPLRVKVREFIHYARKFPRQQGDQQGQAARPGEGGGYGQQVSQGQAQHAYGQGQQRGLSLATNRYALPDVSVSGEPMV